jgi:hypothetical protein
MNTTTTKKTEINLSAEIIKNIVKSKYYSEDVFLTDANAYINAIRENRMINVIGKVSASGMSRTLKFTSCEHNKNTNSYYQRHYISLFEALGYKETKNDYGYFRVNGCGMDMIFNTNKNIIHDFKRIGLISEDECRKLAQLTPTTI